MNITRYADIPRFIQHGAWECDFQPDEAVDWVQRHTVNMTPDFQRGHVWTQEQQVAWLEFFLRGGKTGRVIYLNCPSFTRPLSGTDGEFVCVDGLQRYTAIKRFVDGEIRAFGSYAHEYTDRIRSHCSLRINVNDLQTRAEVLAWYLEMNSGGTPHADDELARVRKLMEAIKSK